MELPGPVRPAREMQRETEFNKIVFGIPRHCGKAGGPSMTMGGAGIKEYLKRAFLYRWNLLIFMGGMVASVLSPFPDAAVPAAIRPWKPLIWAD
jgi:hypothetical protein